MTSPWVPPDLSPLPALTVGDAKPLPRCEVEQARQMMWAHEIVWGRWATCRTAPLAPPPEDDCMAGHGLLYCPWETWCAHCDNCWRCRAWFLRPAGHSTGLFRELVATFRDRVIGRSPGERVRG